MSILKSCWTGLKSQFFQLCRIIFALYTNYLIEISQTLWFYHPLSSRPLRRVMIVRKRCNLVLLMLCQLLIFWSKFDVNLELSKKKSGETLGFWADQDPWRACCIFHRTWSHYWKRDLCQVRANDYKERLKCEFNFSLFYPSKCCL